MIDDLGHPVDLTAPPARVVSLVPSLTEALATSAPDALVGATDWCTHTAGLDPARVRGTKNPDLAAIAELAPDVVLANQEENRELDVRRLRERGIAVWVTAIETVDEAVGSLGRIFTELLGRDEPDWLLRARDLWRVPAPHRGTVAVPIWRDPWMVVGRDTFAGDLLARLGWSNTYADHADRYPHVTVEEVEAREPDLVVLPDEPYEFTATDGPEVFTAPTRLVSGRLLTWYGPSLVEAHAELSAQLETGPIR